MSYDGLLNKTCTVKRKSITGTKGSDGHDTGTYANSATGVVVRKVEGVGQERENNTRITRSTHRLYFLALADVKQDDVIVIDSEDYQVEHVKKVDGASEEHHRVALAWRLN